MNNRRIVLRRTEILSSMATMLVAALAAFEALRYGFGTIGRIGPGFLPLVYATILGGLGLAITISGIKDETQVAATRIRPLLCVTASLLAWIFLAPRAGFAIATVCLVLISGLAEGCVRPAEIVLLSIAAAIIGSLIIVSFGVHLPIWPWP